MIAVGLVVTFAGFLIAVVSLGATDSTTARIVMMLAGIAVSLGGIMGVLAPHYAKNAVWRK